MTHVNTLRCRSCGTTFESHASDGTAAAPHECALIFDDALRTSVKRANHRNENPQGPNGPQPGAVTSEGDGVEVVLEQDGDEGGATRQTTGAPLEIKLPTRGPVGSAVNRERQRLARGSRKK